MITERIRSMLDQADGPEPAFPPTVLFGEGWLLRVVIDWFTDHGGDRYPLSPMPGARWFAEAWLPSAFMARHRGDPMAESRTHADAVIGHFAIGQPGTAGLTLSADAKQLVVLEAKLASRLSIGVKNAPYFDQAARTVGCMAEVLRRSDREPGSMDDLAFLVLAPRARIDDGVFAREIDRESIRAKVRRRAEEFGDDRMAWFEEWFEPTLDRVDLRAMAWEDVIETVAFHAPVDGQLVDTFYGRCLHHTRPRNRSAYPGPRAGANRPWSFARSKSPAVDPRRLEPIPLS